MLARVRRTWRLWCGGAGGGTTGHPTEWIQLDRREGRIPETCKYCGLRYVMSENAVHGH